MPLRRSSINIYWIYKEPSVLTKVNLGLCCLFPSASSPKLTYPLQEESSPPLAAPGKFSRLCTTPSLHSVYIFTSALSAPCCDSLHACLYPPSHHQSMVRAWSYSLIHPPCLTDLSVWYVINKGVLNKWMSEQPGWNSTLDKIGKSLKRLKGRLKSRLIWVGGGKFPDLSPPGILQG